MPVGTDRIAAFCEAATLVELYWAGRMTLVSRPQDIDVYDRVFHGWFSEEPPRPQVRVEGELAFERAPASREEVLREKRFVEMTDDELARVELPLPVRRSRRLVRARAGRTDLRRTLRRSFRTGGEPVELAWRARRVKPRRVVLLLDVSGSMSDYARAVLALARAGVRAGVEVFSFGTRLTRLTRGDAIPDWGGGTRIGDSLERFLREHSRVARGAVVVICSDGLDVGDPELVRAQMARLARFAHKIVWLNPLSEDERYAPLARGMAAALPYVDVFASGHNLATLDELALL